VPAMPARPPRCVPSGLEPDRIVRRCKVLPEDARGLAHRGLEYPVRPIGPGPRAAGEGLSLRRLRPPTDTSDPRGSFVRTWEGTDRDVGPLDASCRCEERCPQAHVWRPAQGRRAGRGSLPAGQVLQFSIWDPTHAGTAHAQLTLFGSDRLDGTWQIMMDGTPRALIAFPPAGASTRRLVVSVLERFLAGWRTGSGRSWDASRPLEPRPRTVTSSGPSLPSLESR